MNSTLKTGEKNKVGPLSLLVRRLIVEYRRERRKDCRLIETLMSTVGSPVSNADPFKCWSCSKRFSTRGQRDAHADEIHHAVVNVKFKDGASEVMVRDRNGKFHCRCHRTYTHGRSIQQHSKTCDYSVRKCPSVGEPLMCENGNKNTPLKDSQLT